MPSLPEVGVAWEALYAHNLMIALEVGIIQPSSQIILGSLYTEH